VDARFAALGTAEPYGIYTGTEDDPVDNVPDVVGYPRLMVDMAWFSDAQNWDD
jgi:hypothetical protein